MSLLPVRVHGSLGDGREIADFGLYGGACAAIVEVIVRGCSGDVELRDTGFWRGLVGVALVVWTWTKEVWDLLWLVIVRM